MIAAVLATWVAVSVPAAFAVGRLLRRNAEYYPVYDPAPVNIVYGGTMPVLPHPLGRHELQRIVNLFDRTALVVDEPLAGYAEIVFPEEADAWRFVGVARDGLRGATPFAESVEVVARLMLGDECATVTLGVTLLSAWWPAGVAA